MAFRVVLFTVVAAFASATAGDDNSAAVKKVIELLEDLQTKVQAEGLKEAETYDTFACFCKETVTSKQDNIQSGKDMKESLTTQINKDTAKRDELDGEIKDLEKEITDKEKEIVILKKDNKEALEVFAVNSADLKNAIKGLDGAIKVLKANKASVKFLQLPKEVKDTIESAALMANALGLAKGKALLQKGDGDEELNLKVEDFKFSAGDIVGTLEGLQTDFKAKKTDVDAEEKTRKDKYDVDLKDAQDFVELKEGEVKDRQKTRSEKIEAIATASSDFSGISAEFLDDQQYLQELVNICSDKAKTWDVRNKVRSDEIQALTAAIGICKGTVSEKTSDKTVRLIQQRFSATRAELTVRDPEAMEAVEADAEQQEDSGAFPLGFLQRRAASSHPHLDSVGLAAKELDQELDHPMQKSATVAAVSKGASGPADGRQMVLNLLRKQGMVLHSSMLTSLAAKIEGDAFAKVKVLIQELIQRMLAESAEEANQKGWCDKSLSDARQKRDHLARDLGELNIEMATQEARRDELVEELATLKTEIDELTKAQEKADETRKTEKEENAATVTEAKEGLDAVRQAIQILDRFYKTAAKSKVELKSLLQGPADDMPDSGFESGEAYTGAGGDAKGVIGMLEVIESDFVRTVKKTEEAEAQAEDDHLKFTTETQMSLAKKNQATTIKTTQKDEAVDKLEAATEGMNTKTELLVGTIKELKSLHDTCIDTGMTYKERVAAREDELAALQKALCIFNAYAEMGPDGAGNSC